MIKTVLFDLDGTLLPMDQEVFAKAYFKTLAERVAPLGYEPKSLVDGLWQGTAAMVKNDGSCTNEEAFWKKFTEIFGERVLDDKPSFNEYYRTDFVRVRDVCGYNPKAKQAVDKLKSMGCRVALATNPIFPATATESRIAWAGFKPEDFEIYTTYENTSYCKPNPKYYEYVLARLGAKPEECLMVGNDVTEDMVARELGINVFLLTDCLINKENKDISIYPNGGFEELLTTAAAAAVATAGRDA